MFTFCRARWARRRRNEKKITQLKLAKYQETKIWDERNIIKWSGWNIFLSFITREQGRIFHFIPWKFVSRVEKCSEIDMWACSFNRYLRVNTITYHHLYTKYQYMALPSFFQTSAMKILKYEQLKFTINVNNKKWLFHDQKCNFGCCGIHHGIKLQVSTTF